MSAADANKAAIQSFAERAAAADLEALMAAFDDAVRQSVDTETMRQHLVSTVVPYFKDFRRVDTYETIAQASFPDGGTGIVHYTYIENSDGTLKPITIALRSAGETVRVVNISVGECVKERHPRSERRCP